MRKSDTDYLKDTVRAWLTTTPKTQAELEALTGIDRRDIRRIVRELRIDGLKICSGNAGFWIWDGEDASWERTKKQLLRKGANTLELFYAIANNEKHEGQLTFELEGVSA